MFNRIDCTEKAKTLIEELKEIYGELMFYQGGGCCEGTQPQCLRKGEIYLRKNDVCIGTIEDVEFWIDNNWFEYWKYSHFSLDVLDEFGTDSFSLEGSLNKTFKINYRLFTPEELENLEPIKMA